MNNNKENYKNAMNQIHPNEKLKSDTIEKIVQKKKSRVNVFIKYATACAVFAICVSIGAFYVKDRNVHENNIIPETKIAQVEDNLPRFKNMNELKEAIGESSYRYTTKSINGTITSAETAITDSTATADTSTNKSEKEYSKTNTQVENVDEADIVKTDGNYIYYTSQNKVYIINSENLKQESVLNFEYDDKEVYPEEIYIRKNKLVVIGTEVTTKSTQYSDNEEDTFIEYARIRNKAKTTALVYDISNKSNPKEVRQLSVDGDYLDSRMIESNLYIVSAETAYYCKGMDDIDILPAVKDTAVSEESQTIKCTDIAYFEGEDTDAFITLAGINIDNKEPANIETILGSWASVYANEKNLYLTQENYKYSYITYREKYTTTIYKFNLDNGKIKLQTKTEVEGEVNDQFSMDEYDGKLRIATTAGYNGNTENILYILDEDLKEVGKLDNMAKGEEIYSVRFIGKIGYIVTFEEIDPLFVIDLSDPTSPTIKGELKIPGYSSYLHPYDETHIIGIGYNTKSNGYGGVVNTNMKMSMFDVSDLNNPVEIFNVDIGENNVSSEMSYNHKALFYNKEKNLIGFGIRDYLSTSSYKATSKFLIYKIDLEKGFQEYGEIAQVYNWSTDIDRAIYIDNKLYTLAETEIKEYNLENMEKIAELELE